MRKTRLAAGLALVLGGSLWLGVSPWRRQRPLPVDVGAQPKAAVVPNAVIASAPKTPSSDREAQPSRAPVVSSDSEGDGVSPPPAADQKVYGTPSASLVAGLKDGRWITQGDVLVDETRFIPDAGDNTVHIVDMASVGYWAGGVVPYLLDADVDTVSLKEAVDEFQRRTVVRFVERSDQPDYVVFHRADTVVCQSYLGRKGGEQDVFLHQTCATGQILHELMHTLGFVHEQSRADRDQYVQVAWDEIQPAYKNQFQKLPASISLPTPQPFDFGSILLYPSNAFSANGRLTLTRLDGTAFQVNRRALSPLDVEKVNALYGGGASNRPQ